ncbi:hypothetical protein PVNG_00093 [Plasmodium vivax North Korean]|uniref:Uncharacterized protein n=1 Tax=Plasmodium vivax North Korean TaxID=1035514 RepID=A0A0J9TMR6_PLAVI|nr:hypothetical protein PVNG_00093 [Plasmodium vivax North Korean]
MNPLNDEKLEKISNSELIRRIMELQNSLIIISDHMELLKNKNRILDEENEKLEKHIRDIVNDVKTELTQKFDQKRSPQFSYAPVMREEEEAAENCNGFYSEQERTVQREPCQGQTYANPNSVAPVPTDAASPSGGTPYGDSSLIAHTTNVQSGQHTNRATPNENETKSDQTSFENISEQHVNNKNLQKKEGQNLNLLKEPTKSNIYNLLMETEKLNSIFNIASNVLNTSFFSTSKEQDGKRKGSQCVQVSQGVNPIELDEQTQWRGSKNCKQEPNRTEGISQAKNYVNCPGGGVPQGGAEVKGGEEAKENRGITDGVEIMEGAEIKQPVNIAEGVDAEEDADITGEALNEEESPTGPDTEKVEDEIPSEVGHSLDDKIATPLDSHQMEESLNGEKDKNDGDDQTKESTPDKGDTIKRES